MQPNQRAAALTSPAGYELDALGPAYPPEVPLRARLGARIARWLAAWAWYARSGGAVPGDHGNPLPPRVPVPGLRPRAAGGRAGGGA